MFNGALQVALRLQCNRELRSQCLGTSNALWSDGLTIGTIRKPKQTNGNAFRCDQRHSQILPCPKLLDDVLIKLRIAGGVLGKVWLGILEDLACSAAAKPKIELASFAVNRRPLHRAFIRLAQAD